MPVIDIDVLTGALDGDAPCGPDMEWEGINALEDLAAITPERQFGDTIEPAREPEWPAVRDAALALFERTRDLRVGVYLATALLRTDGWEGWADGLEVLARLCADHWDTVHPRIDSDSAGREGTLGLLSTAPTLRALRALPLVRSPVLGTVSVRTLQIARGDVAATADEPVLSIADVQAVFRDAAEKAPAEQARMAAQIERAAAALEALASQLQEHGAGHSLERLAELTGDVRAILSELGGAGAGTDTSSAPPPARESDVSVSAGAEPVAGGGAVASRTDVIAALDRIIAYYERQEPSSPVPVLLRRTRTLVGKDFWAIVNDLVPGGRSELEVLRGSASKVDDSGED